MLSDPDAGEPTPVGRRHRDRGMTEAIAAAEAAGVDPAFIHAWREVGYIVTRTTTNATHNCVPEPVLWAEPTPDARPATTAEPNLPPDNPPSTATRSTRYEPGPTASTHPPSDHPPPVYVKGPDALVRAAVRLCAEPGGTGDAPYGARNGR